MAGQNPSSNVDLFDAYFRRADLDQDGRISGAEAVSFFQGSNLPKNVLAQIWMHADQNRTGYLGRAEFYNALKLVTVAQSKRELTPDIVKAALFGPAAAKIPAPQINLAATAAPQSSTAPQMGAAAAAASQNHSFRGPQVLPNMSVNQQQFPSQANQYMRPPVPTASGSLQTQGAPGQGYSARGTMTPPHPANSSVSTDWLGGRSGGPSLDSNSQVPNRGVTPSMGQDGFGMGLSGLTSSLTPTPQLSSGPTHSVAPRPQLPSYQSASKDSKALAASENGFASDSVFGGDVFSTSSSLPKQDASSPTFSASTAPVSSSSVPVSTGAQSSAKQSPLDALQSTYTMQPAGTQLQRTQSDAKQNQQIPTQSTSTVVSSGISTGAGNSSLSQSQPPWPRMTKSDIQKYTKVFVEVDTDRDGKITGEQARNLFLSWRLPREVLKQVWDLSDQDSDSMLSLREFCTALYLMERYREGRPLPAALPNSIMFDETLLQPAGQPAAAYGNAAWGPTPGMQQHQGMPGSRQMIPPAGVRPQGPQTQVPSYPQADRGGQSNQQKSGVPVLEKHLVNQLSKEEQNSLNFKSEEATEADKKVEELEKEILDSKEKIEYYRTKMQELVLYKSRCDNRLNEITERASADKKEVESLTKKYEEKYKQVGDIASKLTIEEATFRDIQERKLELYNAIAKIEQGGSADGILQVRADRIQAELEELVKALNERCKKYELRAKPTALVELPFGWQPGIQEGVADWDEDWDKFEDEGFTFVKELTQDVQNIVAPPKEKSVWKEKASAKEDLPVYSSSNADSTFDMPNGTATHTKEDRYHAHSEDESARSPSGSPTRRSKMESSSQDFRDTHVEKNEDASPRARERYSDHGGAESFISGDKSFDEPTWGTFDTNDDTDSVWGFPKESDHERDKESSFFGSSDFDLNPIRTESPQGSSLFGGKKSPFNVVDSVPGTPLFNSGNSPARYSEGSHEEHRFDNFAKFDSFSMNDNEYFPPQDNRSLARFDSVRSTMESEHSQGLPSFDDTDPFGSSGPFKTGTDLHAGQEGPWPPLTCCKLI